MQKRTGGEQRPAQTKRHRRKGVYRIIFEQGSRKQVPKAEQAKKFAKFESKGRNSNASCVSESQQKINFFLWPVNRKKKNEPRFRDARDDWGV